MNLLEFNNLKLNDPVLDCYGNLSKAYDIDRQKRAVMTGLRGSTWRSFRDVQLPGAKRKTGQLYKKHEKL